MALVNGMIQGMLLKDGYNNPIQSPTGFTMTDASGTPKVSPVATNTTEVDFTFPENAVALNVNCVEQAGELRLVAGGATGGKFAIPANTVFTIPGKPGAIVYIGRAITTTISFAFLTV